jgi:hypothetical protein
VVQEHRGSRKATEAAMMTAPAARVDEKQGVDEEVLRRGGLHTGKENDEKWLGGDRSLSKGVAAMWSSGGGGGSKHDHAAGGVGGASMAVIGRQWLEADGMLRCEQGRRGRLTSGPRWHSVGRRHQIQFEIEFQTNSNPFKLFHRPADVDKWCEIHCTTGHDLKKCKTFLDRKKMPPPAALVAQEPRRGEHHRANLDNKDQMGEINVIFRGSMSITSNTQGKKLERTITLA